MRLNFVLGLTALALFGCKANPYPDGKVSTKPQREFAQPPSPYGINVESLMLFDEGIETQYPVSVSVPTGNPIIEWQNLPAGAVYDAMEKVLRWRPGFEAANDDNNPAVKMRDYEMFLLLRSDADSVSSRRVKLVMRVKDTPRPIELPNAPTTSTINEGESKVLAEFNLQSADFPRGVFRGVATNLPAGFSLEKSPTENKWKLKATIGFDAIKVGCAAANCKVTTNHELTFYAPDGREVKFAHSSTMSDIRKNVTVALPLSMEVKGDVKLNFLAVDPNLEMAPVVTLDEVPTVGLMELVASNEEELAPNEKTYTISWTQIPVEAQNQTFRFRLRSCNSLQGTTLNSRNCTVTTHNAFVAPRNMVNPTISRANWERGITKFFITNKESVTTIVTDAGRNDLRVMGATATSTDSGDQVSYTGSTLRVTPRAPGAKALTITAQNSIGGMATETYLYEALPANWSSNVVIGLAGNIPELTAFESKLGTNFNREFIAPEFRGARAQAFRKMVYTGTHGLMLPEGKENFAFYHAALKDAFISTPRLDLLPTTLKNELSTLGVDVVPAPADFELAQHVLLPARGFTAPPTRVPVLKGTTTSESRIPAMFSVSSTSDCAKIFHLKKLAVPPIEYPVGVVCRRTNGGKLIVLGFEWADIDVAPEDTAVLTQWFQKMQETL